MTSKRTTSSTLADSNSDYIDGDGDIKKRRINVTDNFDIINNIENSGHVSKYIRIAENECNNQGNSFEFAEKSGPQHLLPAGSKPIDYFNLFFTDSLWTMVVEETNRYAENLLLTSSANANSRLRNWYPVNVLEMKAFVAVLFEMEITRRPTISSYWTVGSREIPWFRKMFSRNRFQNLLRCFHAVDYKKCFPPGQERYDACAEFNPVLEHANQVFQKHYTPHKILYIEEFLGGTMWDSSLAQYLPNKKYHKWGMRFWMLCDAVSKYCVSFNCFRGPKSKIWKNGLGFDVIKKLLEDADCLNKGHHVYVDNFFISTALAKFLCSKNTYITGTIKKGEKDIPDEAKQIKVAETKYFRDGEVLLCAHREKGTPRNLILLISTDVSSVIKKSCEKEKEKTKPSIINSYNNVKGITDESDKMLYTYLDERRTLKSWKKVTFNIFSRMVLNSYLLYKETEGREAMSRLQYTSNIITQIESEWIVREESESTTKIKNTYGLEKLPGRNLRRCVVCSTKDSVKRSNLICIACKKGLHPLCFPSHVCKF